MHLLIVEDDIDLGPALLAALKADGLTATWVRRLADARPDDTVACVLLDLSLPDGDGLALLSRWRREHADVPVIVISARATLDERLAALHGGADDFLVKPFAVSELIARLWAVLRRSARQSSEVWQLGDLSVEPRACRVSRDGVPLELSPREFRLLVELAREPGAVVSKSTLGQRLEPHGDPLDPATVEVHLSNLRRKLGSACIETIRGVGYRWCA